MKVNVTSKYKSLYIQLKVNLKNTVLTIQNYNQIIELTGNAECGPCMQSSYSLAIALVVFP